MREKKIGRARMARTLPFDVASRGISGAGGISAVFRLRIIRR